MQHTLAPDQGQGKRGMCYYGDIQPVPEFGSKVCLDELQTNGTRNRLHAALPEDGVQAVGDKSDRVQDQVSTRIGEVELYHLNG